MVKKKNNGRVFGGAIDLPRSLTSPTLNTNPSTTTSQHHRKAPSSVEAPTTQLSRLLLCYPQHSKHGVLDARCSGGGACGHGIAERYRCGEVGPGRSPAPAGAGDEHAVCFPGDSGSLLRDRLRDDGAFECSDDGCRP